MGEFATRKSDGQSIKIGTCENMYYLRADQADQVTPQRGSVDPIMHRAELRFRFPWPDEDGVAPGDFEKHARTAALWSVRVPEGVEHSKVQFTSEAGYVLSLPCPESPEGKGLGAHRNGFRGYVLISQQKWVNGKLVLVCECGGCGAKYRVEAKAAADEIVAECLKRAEKEDSTFWRTVAERIEAGYSPITLLNKYTAALKNRLAAAQAITQTAETF